MCVRVTFIATNLVGEYPREVGIKSEKLYKIGSDLFYDHILFLTNVFYAFLRSCFWIVSFIIFFHSTKVSYHSWLRKTPVYTQIGHWVIFFHPQMANTTK